MIIIFDEDDSIYYMVCNFKTKVSFLKG